MGDSLRLIVPASTSNLGAGFDTFGLALTLYNTFEIYESDAFEVEVYGEGEDSLPSTLDNLFLRTYIRTCQELGVEDRPIKVIQKNGIPLGRGLGSSATAILGGILTASELNNIKLSPKEVLEIAFIFESHPDNLVPALVGGFTISAVGENKKVYFEKLDFPEELQIVVLIPEFEILTEEARRVLPKFVPLEDAVFNIQRASLLVAALVKKDFELLREAVEDRLHQPFRNKLLHGFEAFKEEAYKMGADAVFISGSGSTIGVFTRKNADEIGKFGVEMYKKLGIGAHYKILEADKEGARWAKV
jgi:homoserine kinase